MKSLKNFLLMGLAAAVFTSSLFLSVNAESETLPSAENTEFRYDKIVFNSSAETDYYVKTDQIEEPIEPEIKNIVTNGSFEDSFNGWSSGANYIDSSNASDGTNSATLLQWYHLTQEVSVEKSKSYTFSFDVWNTAKVWATVSILASDGSTELYKIQLDDTFGQNGWQTVSGVFSAGENETVTIDFVADGNYIKIDNVAIKKNVSGDVLVANGSFEDDFTGWTANYNTIDSAQASDGEKSANLVKWYHLTQEVNVEKGASYTFSFDVYNTEGIWTWARILASDGTSALYELQVNQSFGQSGWETISGTFEAGENETVSIDFVADSGNGMKIDNIRIEKIKYKTEPLDGNTIPIEQDKDYTFTIIWERADGSADGEFTVSGKARQLGDVNGDKAADIRDLIALKKGMAKLSAEWVYDITLDNSVNSDDLVSLQRILLEH